MSSNQPDFATFEIGGGIGDIGGDEIDLSSLNVTDTLIGTTMSELTAALGEPSLNEYESYHMGDGGISDIELTSFDSALINEAGVRPYQADEASAMEEGSELAALMGKKLETAPKKKSEKAPAAKKDEPKKEETKAEKPDTKHAAPDAGVALAGIITKFLHNADKVTKDLVEDDRIPWDEYPIYDENGSLIDEEYDETEFEDSDFEMDNIEFEALAEAYESGELTEQFVH